MRKFGAFLGGAVVALWLPAQGLAQERWSFEVRSGTVFTANELKDLANLGATAGVGFSYRFSRYFALRADGDVDILFGNPVGGGATAPDVRLWHYGGGFEVNFARPRYQDVPLTFAVNLGAGATTFDSDEFVAGGQAFDFSKTYFAANGGVRLGYAFNQTLDLFASGRAYLIFADKEDTSVFTLISNELKPMENVWSFPLTVGLRVSVP